MQCKTDETQNAPRDIIPQNQAEEEWDRFTIRLPTRKSENQKLDEPAHHDGEPEVDKSAP